MSEIKTPESILRPCPFCGGYPKIWFSVDDGIGINCKAKAEVYCYKCGAKIQVNRERRLLSEKNPGYEFIEMERAAKEKWNVRA